MLKQSITRINIFLIVPVRLCINGCLLLFLLLGYIILLVSYLLILSMFNCMDSAKLIEIYRNRHNISASGGLSDPAVATGISDLMYESKVVQKETNTVQSGIDPDLAMAWAAGLEDDVWANNAPAVDKVRFFVVFCKSLLLCIGFLPV